MQEIVIDDFKMKNIKINNTKKLMSSILSKQNIIPDKGYISKDKEIDDALSKLKQSMDSYH